MTKYLINRILRGIGSVIIVVGVVMILIYSCMDRDMIFVKDPLYTKQMHNAKEVYKMQQWEDFGYLDYVSYADWLKSELRAGNIDQETYNEVIKFGDTASADSAKTSEYVKKFKSEYESKGYTFQRLDAKKKAGISKYHPGGEPRIYVYKDVALLSRLWNYLTGIFFVDNIHYAQEDVGERGLTFTLYDPAYGGDKFAPAIIGNGTLHKYLLYTTDTFPYIHQNLLTVQLGKSYSVNRGLDVFHVMTRSQGSYVKSMVTYPSGVVEESADDLHSATYMPGSLENGTVTIKRFFVDDYTNVATHKNGMSRMGYSFVIGILSVIMAYVLAVPLGITMALNKDKFIDKLGTFYIVFIMAVPSLGYIFMFKAIGGKLGLPTTFDMENPSAIMFILPVVSLALPSVAGLMKWLRRYMIDQMNSDYVKFARSGGLSEGEIFSKHILKNAIIPVVHGIPGSVLGALTGAIITERVYVVPGVGNVLTNAINAYDNGVIVGVTLFYATLSVVSIIAGDILMSLVDPRISFASKAR